MLGGVRKSHRPVQETTRDGVKTGGSASSSLRDDAGRGPEIASSVKETTRDRAKTGGSHRPRETMLGG
jgi:hypothetical protein